MWSACIPFFLWKSSLHLEWQYSSTVTAAPMSVVGKFQLPTLVKPLAPLLTYLHTPQWDRIRKNCAKNQHGQFFTDLARNYNVNGTRIRYKNNIFLGKILGWILWMKMNGRMNQQIKNTRRIFPCMPKLFLSEDSPLTCQKANFSPAYQNFLSLCPFS